MSSRDDEPADLVAAAAVDALMTARWQCADLLARKSPEMARDLLRGHAAELASSPIAHDQILSRALDAAAADLEARRPPLQDGVGFFFRGQPPCSTAKLIVREQVFRGRGVPARVSDDAAAELERRFRPECRADHDLSGRLSDEARLHELLWDDPRLPAETHTRLIMLCTVPKVVERAQALDPSRARWAFHRDQPRRRRRRALALVSPRAIVAAPRKAPEATIRWPVAGWLTALALMLAGAGWMLIDP